jgi:DNA-binding transcriptional ArsR family regulator
VARLSTELMRRNALEKMAETLRAIAHPVRLQIVNILMNGERSVGEMVKTLGTKQSLTSQQLSILKLKGLLKSRRKGNVVYYFIENTSIKKIITAIIATL